MSEDSREPEGETTSVGIRFDRALPMVCALCGNPGKHGVILSFAEADVGAAIGSAISILISSALAPIGMLYAMGRKKTVHKVRIPLCREHRWFRRFHGAVVTCLVLSALLLPLALVWFVDTMTTPAARRGVDNHTTFLLVAIPVLVSLLAGSIYRVVKDSAIRAASVTNRGMVLGGVAPEFAEAVKERERNATARVDS